MTGMGFFNSRHLVTQKVDKGSNFISVGGELFHAVSVALIDHIKSGNRLSSPSLNKIQDAFSRYFPDYKLNLIHLAPNSPCRSELVERMAYVLRQLAVDEVFEQATEYRELFKGLSPNTPQDYLRAPSTPLHFSVLGALAKVLGIQFQLSFIEEKGDLRHVQSIHGLRGDAFELSLEIQGNDYSPNVVHQQNFKFLGHITLNAIPCEKETRAGTVQTALNAIEDDNRILFELYAHYHTILYNLVRDGDLTRARLIQCYIDFIPTEYSTHGIYSAQFFTDKTQGLAGEVIESSEQHDIRLLIHNLAGWMATGQLDSGHFFDMLEVQKPSSDIAMSL